MSEIKSKNKTSGQSLIEIIIAIVLGALLIGVSSGAVAVTLKTNLRSKTSRISAALLQELSDELRTKSESDWNFIYSISPKGTSNSYYLVNAGGATLSLTVTAGKENKTVDNFNFERFFYVENVTRDGNGNIGAGAEDPSTQKLTVVVNHLRGLEAVNNYQNVFYLIRHNNRITKFTSWSGGPGVSGPITEPTSTFFFDSDVDYSGTPGSLLATTSGGYAISSTFDIGLTKGAAFNSIMWFGSLGGGDTVRFQFASSDCPNGKTNPPDCDDTGDWTYLGPDGTGTTHYIPTGPDSPTQLNLAQHNNKQYFRYRLEIVSSGAPTSQVDDVIVNWSP